MLWFPVGYTVGYLVLLLLVAAPLRRSGAYTLPDFAEMPAGARCRCAGSRAVLVVLIGWLYLLPQFQGAGLTLRAAHRRTRLGRCASSWPSSSASRWRPVACARSPSCRPSSTGSSSPRSRSPRCSSSLAWYRDGAPVFAAGDWGTPLSGYGGREYPLYATYSIVLATFLGTMGLPHVLVRFYTNPDGGAARRTTLAVLVLLSASSTCSRRSSGRSAASTPPSSRAPRPPTPWCSCCPGGVFERLARPVAVGARRGRRLRRVPVDRERAVRLGRRRAVAGPAHRGEPLRRRRTPVPASAPSSRSWCRACSRWSRVGSTSRRR